jgi:hypothetical protein
MKRFWIVAGLGTFAAIGLAAVAVAAPPASGQKVRTTPFGYNVDGKNNRIEKGKRTTNPDGSWREEIPQGAGCVKVREMSASREYREHAECAAGGSGS